MKMLYYAPAHPSIPDRDAFLARWRLHGARAMAHPRDQADMHLYIQAEPIAPAPLAGFEPKNDAIAIVVREDITDFDALRAEIAADPARRAHGEMVAQDELETFDGPVLAHTLMLTEEVLLPGEPGGAAAYMFFDDFDAARKAGASVASVAGATRVVLNAATSAGALDHAGVIELTAPTLEALVAIVQGAAAESVALASHTVLARETVFWDRVSRADAFA